MWCAWHLAWHAAIFLLTLSTRQDFRGKKHGACSQVVVDIICLIWWELSLWEARNLKCPSERSSTVVLRKRLSFINPSRPLAATARYIYMLRISGPTFDSTIKVQSKYSYVPAHPLAHSASVDEMCTCRTYPWTNNTCQAKIKKALMMTTSLWQ